MFAIRQKSTGYFMPSFKGRAGGTHCEPDAKAVPRLFSRHQDAKAALSWWLEGKVRALYDYEREISDLDIVPVKERNNADMEIVRVSLTVEVV